MAKTIELEITGMTCDHCVKAVTNALKDVTGVSDAVVSLEKKQATVTADLVDLGARARRRRVDSHARISRTRPEFAESG